MSAELATLAADPSRVEDVGRDAIPALIGEVETLKARLWARLQAVEVAPAPTPSTNGGPDKLLTAEEAAERLSVDKRWVYRKADSLPFTRRLGTGTLRFSSRGLERWKESRK